MPVEHHQITLEHWLPAAGILPVVTVDSVEQGTRLAEALLEGGLHCIELTLRTPAAIDAIAAIKKAYPTMRVGAGTVLSERQIRESIDAGSDFLVTPGTPPVLVELLAQAPVPVVPGGATPTEFLSLMDHGFRICKLFPASAMGGIAMLKGLAGPMPTLKLMPTGGITEADAGAYLAQPNVLGLGGSWIAPREWLAANAFDKIRDAAAKAAAIVRQAQSAR